MKSGPGPSARAPRPEAAVQPIWPKIYPPKYPYQELIDLGGLNQAKNKGKLRLEGKDYLVKDGEVVHIRHNM
jgi:hypothetical protein